jgi:hypothetical protein
VILQLNQQPSELWESGKRQRRFPSGHSPRLFYSSWPRTQQGFGSPSCCAAVPRVLSAPDCSLPSGIEQVLKPTYSQTFLAQPSLEALHASILCWLTRLDMHWFDPPFQTPGQEMPAGEFWPIVERIDCGHPRSTMIPSRTRVTRCLAKLVSTSKAKHSRVYASTALSSRIVEPLAIPSCTTSSAYSWFTIVYWRNGALTRRQCFRLFRRKHRLAWR